jgi:pimeloyl-ACP methyl ester carboxylesterase
MIPNPPAFDHQKLEHGHKSLAYAHQAGAAQAPGIFFMPGYASDMQGSKADFLSQQCARAGRAFTRFDYSGHGLSSGRFEDGCIGEWLEDALAIFDAVTQGRQILVGSSMGGWLMLLLALKRPERIAGLVGIAAAPDFTQDLVWEKLTPAQQAELKAKGVLYEPSDYGAPLPYTLKLIEEGRGHLLLDKPIAISAPVHLIQGMKDTDVPWQTALRLMECLTSDQVSLTLIKDGTHRLSRPQDLAKLWDAIVRMA